MNPSTLSLQKSPLPDVELKPHRVRGWLNAKPDLQFAEKCHDICQTYRLAPERAAAGIPTFSIDEMTGIQALERIAPTLPVMPGCVERREFEYTRHGTCTLIASFNNETMAKPFRWTYQANHLTV